MIRLYFASFCIKDKEISSSSLLTKGATLRCSLYAYNEEKNVGVEIVMEQVYYQDILDILNLKKRSTFFNTWKRITEDIILNLLREANFRMIGGTGIVTVNEVKKIIEYFGARKDKLFQFMEISEEKLEGLLDYSKWSAKIPRKKLLKGIRELFTPKNFTVREG